MKQKKIATLALAVFFATGALAQKSVDVKTADVPAPVQESFQKHFPNATGADWEMKGDTYKVEFRKDGSKHFAGFDKNGTRTKHGTAISSSELPENVRAAVLKDNPGAKIEDVYKVEKDGATHYKMELDGKTEKKVVYSANGALVKEKLDD